MCFSLCSSTAVQGVLVLVPRFFPLSSDSNAGIDKLVEASRSAVDVVGGGFTLRGFGSAAGLREAALLRGFRIEDVGGGIVLRVVEGLLEI